MSHRLRAHLDWQALASFCLGLIAAILGMLPVLLAGAFYEDVNALPDALEPLIGFCLWTTVPLGIIAAAWALRVRASADPPSTLAGWGMGLGLSTIVLWLIGMYLVVGASLNTIGP
jgi:hypothetical protein